MSNLDQKENPIQNNHVRILTSQYLNEADRLKLASIVKESLNTIGSYQSALLPQEKTTLTVWDTEARNGSYLGKWHSEHHILTTLGKDNLKNKSEVFILKLLLIHELLHQKVAETLKVDDITGRNIDKLTQNELFISMTEYQQSQAVFGAPSKVSLLQSCINEGFAVTGELLIYDSMLKDDSLTPHQKNIVQISLAERLSDLTQSRNDPYDTYSLGYALMSKLLDIHQPLGITEILLKLDWEEIGKIDNQSPQYKAIMADPRKIPMRS